MAERNSFTFERVIEGARVVESAKVYADTEHEARQILIEEGYLRWGTVEWTCEDGNRVGPPELVDSEVFL